VQHEERAEDRQHADEQREPGGDRAAEHQHEQHHRDRDGDRLGPQDVALDGVADLGEGLRLTADLDLQPLELPAVDRAPAPRRADRASSAPVRRPDHALLPSRAFSASAAGGPPAVT
jgi:hypothetical protein